jgi:lipopolysaccharide heptosyltransferase II
LADDRVFDYLQVYDSRERLMVGCADALLAGSAAASRLFLRRGRRGTPRQILLLRLERIGDLLMTLRAFEAVRARSADAQIHLVVASWNRSVAALIPGIDSVETLDVPWLVRHGTGASTSELVRRALAWRKRHFDLAINFEPDIRSNMLLALGGAGRRVGFLSGGGGDVLTDALPYVPGAHTSANAMRLVDAALPAGNGRAGESAFPRLPVPETARHEASRLLGEASGHGPLVGIHPSGGRQVKQWDLDRFAEVGRQLARESGATIVLTGTSEDRPLVERVAAALPADVRTILLAGSLDLIVFAAVLERLRLLIVGDTGPMHLAAAVGTPVVALFGPSDPARYGPLAGRARIVTADLWCRPCNRVRRPPERCTGHVPDCLQMVKVDAVCEAARSLLQSA